MIRIIFAIIILIAGFFGGLWMSQHIDVEAFFEDFKIVTTSVKEKAQPVTESITDKLREKTANTTDAIGEKLKDKIGN